MLENNCSHTYASPKREINHAEFLLRYGMFSEGVYFKHKSQQCFVEPAFNNFISLQIS